MSQRQQHDHRSSTIGGSLGMPISVDSVGSKRPRKEVVHPPEAGTKESWSEVWMSKKLSSGKVKRAKGHYTASVVVSGSGKVSVDLRRETDEGKDRVLAVTKLPELGDKRLYLDDGYMLEMVTQADALACVRFVAVLVAARIRLSPAQVTAVSRALRGGPGKRRICLDVADPSVQGYITGLLVDPDFEKFVADLGAFYAKMRAALPPTDGAVVRPALRAPSQRDASC